jgi:hypothetical protein
MGVVIGICVKHPGDPTRKTGTDARTHTHTHKLYNIPCVNDLD